MVLHRACFLIWVFLLPTLLAGQEYNYVQYNTRDGLAGSTVYDMCQDKDGFMWFATENGLSRYDGTNFVTFTVKDGLPDNEVLKLFEDSKGRLWVGTFSKDVCFIYKNKVYNKSNSTILKQLSIPGSALIFEEDSRGNVIISDKYNLFFLKNNGQLTDLSNIPQINNSKSTLKLIVKDPQDSSITISIKDSLYLLDDDKLVYLDSAIINPAKFEYNRFVSHRISRNRADFIGLPDTYLSQFNIADNAYLVATTNGAWTIDTVHYKLDLHLLAGKKISRVLLDVENNMWFSALGEGVFKLPSLEIRNILETEKNKIYEKEIFTLEKSANFILAGLGFSTALTINDTAIVRVYKFEEYLSNSTNKSPKNGVKAIETNIEGVTFFGTDAFLLKKEGNKITTLNLVAIKSIAVYDDNSIIVGTAQGVYKVNVSNLNVTDTLYKSRSTKVACINGDVYVGTINGLHQVKTDKSSLYLGNLNPVLTRRITDIKKDNAGRIWVATGDSGVVCIKDNKVLVALSDKDHLSNNICKCLYIDGNYLYVGTNKGLNRIDLLNNYSTLKFSVADGLPSEIINTVCKYKELLYIGTAAGVTYFNEDKVGTKSICRLTVFSTVTSDRINKNGELILAPDQNNFSFRYVAVSFKSAGQITYYYRLIGQSPAWRQTGETHLDFQSIDPGNYRFELYAVNKFGVKSEMYAVKFKIQAPFYKTWWFILLVILFNFGTVSLFFYWRNLQNEKKFIEKNNLQKAFAALEQQALQAQMNPHFIFNCLNSIQQFILTNDKEKANLYLTGFASLIRQTLYLSSNKSVSVLEEAKYLSSYLEMEKMRYGDNFEFTITGYDSPEIAHIQIPALFLQPFVENSLRHGIRNKIEGKGIIVVDFSRMKDTLICFVSDNGIGRIQSEAYKSSMHVEYQSRGIGLARRRIDLLNQMNERKIKFEIIDVTDGNGNARGTEVIVEIPV